MSYSKIGGDQGESKDTNSDGGKIKILKLFVNRHQQIIFHCISLHSFEFFDWKELGLPMIT